jgi:hypothetical protein
VIVVLAHGGTAGAIAEATFLALPVVVFWLLSRWSKRKAAKAAELKAEDPSRAARPPRDGRP